MNLEVEALFVAYDNLMEAPDRKSRRRIFDSHVEELAEKHGLPAEKLAAFVRARYPAWKRSQSPPPSIPPAA